MGYKTKVIKSLGWVGMLRGISRISSFIKVAVAARLLGPEGFGVYAVASLVLALLEILTETGMNAILVQNERGIKKYINTAWIISIIRGLIIFIIIALIAKPVSIFFNKPNSYNLIILIAFAPLIRGFINPSIVKFQKDLEFHKELFFRAPLTLIDAGVSIILLFLLKNSSALVWGMIISTIAELVSSWIFIKPFPKLRFNKYIAREIFFQGKWITSSGIFVYLFTQGDDWVVGKLLGAIDLGLYQVAYKLSTLPTTETANIIIKVVFPTFVKIKDDTVRLRKAYFKTIIATLLFISPFIFIVYLFTEYIIVLFFGKEWLSIVNLVRILLIFSGLMSVTGLSSGLFLAVKKQRYSSNIMLLAVTIMIFTIIPLISLFGLIGAGYSILFSWVVASMLTIFYTLKTLKYI